MDEGRLQNRQESVPSPGIADPHGKGENLEGGYMALHQQTLGVYLVGGWYAYPSEKSWS